jgi:hypothetical protein
MTTDPKKPAADDHADSPPSEVQEPIDGDEGPKNIEEKGEPFDGNFA